jgi:hypothetical protein
MDFQMSKQPEAASGAQEYDVAISFLVKDDKIAKALADQLGESPKVFYFPRAQGELAGTDGMETMRNPFLDGSRVMVVLYRERGKIAKPDAASRARRTRQEAEFLADRGRLLRDRTWIEGVVHASVADIVQNVVQLVKENCREIQPPIQAGARVEPGGSALFCVISDGRVSVAAGWKQGIFNNARDQAGFFVREFLGAVAVPGSGLQYIFEPKLLKECQFHVEINTARELVWAQKPKSEMLSNDELANRVTMIFLDLIGKANRGEVPTE